MCRETVEVGRNRPTAEGGISVAKQQLCAHSHVRNPANSRLAGRLGSAQADEYNNLVTIARGVVIIVSDFTWGGIARCIQALRGGALTTSNWQWATAG